MPFPIPHTDNLSTNILNRVFKDTVATYKYYWFMSILNIHVKTGSMRIGMRDIIISMIANAWYPIHYFKLSFGKSDSMYPAIMGIMELTGLPVDADREMIQAVLKECFERDDRKLKKLLKVFSQNVPYRFLNPWISTPDNREMAMRLRRTWDSNIGNIEHIRSWKQETEADALSAVSKTDSSSIQNRVHFAFR